MPEPRLALRYWRRARLMSQTDLCRIAEIQQATYSRIETGLLDPDALTQQKIATVLGVPAEALFTPLRATRPSEEATS